jgi:glutamyl-tRNA reductase
MVSRIPRPADQLEGCLYLHPRTTVLFKHAFAVAFLVYSNLVLGEPQILGSLNAYRAAQEHGPRTHVESAFQATFSVAKRVRTETRIGANAVSVADRR